MNPPNDSRGWERQGDDREATAAAGPAKAPPALTEALAQPASAAPQSSGRQPARLGGDAKVGPAPPDERERSDLLIIDDMLPTQFSPFRTLEYSHYLSSFDAILLSTERWRPWVPEGDFEHHLAALPIDPGLKPRVRRFAKDSAPQARLGYVTFLSNAARSLPFFERRKIPFILQLYPGGGFQLDQVEIDRSLKAVLSSALCRKVVTTQSITRRYVLERIGCDPSKVEFIFGGVFDSRGEFDFHRDKPRYPRQKPTLDVCFVAHKYKKSFSAKGYDSFVAIARRLVGSFRQLRFHVVGNFAAGDLELGGAAQHFTFYGARPHGFLPGFYAGMDMIVSINRPFTVYPGSFDGFPTGACIEAGFRGVLNCINDPLALNESFVPDQDFVLLDFDLDRSVATLGGLIADPDRLYRLAYANWRRFHEVFGIDRQLCARTRIMTSELLRLKAAAGDSRGHHGE